MGADTLSPDTLGLRRRWLYLQAKVVSNSVTAQNNFIVLSRGSAQQLRKDAGVVDLNNGVVGIVTDVSPHYAVVMSLLHKDSRISVKLKRGEGGGQVTWDGKEPNRLTLSGVKKSFRVAKGDTVITSGITPTFPYGMEVGTVEEVVPDKSTNDFLIKLKTSVNFYNLQYVYAIDNSQRDEINRMLEKAKSRINN
jgi:rod shape-determining protein MreC